MRQAIVIIHGIGEQRPLATIRQFISAITDGVVRSKPDRMSESFELRRFQIAGTQSLPLTDVYELYWAHHMGQARWDQTFRWVAGLTFRRTRTLPPGLRSMHRALWTVLLLSLGGLLYSAVRAFGPTGSGLGAFFQSAMTYAPVAAILGQWIFGRIVLGYVGDAARYLTPKPENIEARTKIRSEGVQLLRHLHRCRAYSRIVVVGHSLGSVIGYDVLRHLWDEMRLPSFKVAAPQPEATQFEVVIARLENPPEGTSQAAAVDEFQQAQHRLWREQRALQAPWLITDFVTLGSPLAHAELLFEDPIVTLEQRRRERELPTCPPTSGADQTHYGENRVLKIDGVPRKWYFRIPHHGAVFSGTRWTNLYFPHRRLILGDIVGGPLTETLGRGIRDVAVRPSRPGFFSKTLASHIMYWQKATESAPKLDRDARKDLDRSTGTKDAITALRSALQLEANLSKNAWPNP